MRKALLTPREIQVRPVGTNRAEVTLEPLERGFGHTLGNALRRILLSSISGAAVIQVKLISSSHQVLHEYTVMEAVQEDVLHILLNLKNLAVRLDGIDEATLRLKSSAEGQVTAAAIELVANVSIHNPDLVIANLAVGADLDMEIKVCQGIGYDPADARTYEAGEELQIGELPVDAFYSPVRRVSYAVDAARVEQRTDLDSLMLEIETNGTVDPESAVREAAQILQQQLNAFLGVQMVGVSEEETQKARQASMLLKPVEELGLSQRSVNSLRSVGFEHIGDLVSRTEIDLLQTPKVGKKSIDEIKDALKAHNLTLGMELEVWPPAGD